MSSIIIQLIKLIYHRNKSNDIINQDYLDKRIKYFRCTKTDTSRLFGNCPKWKYRTIRLITFKIIDFFSFRMLISITDVCNLMDKKQFMFVNLIESIYLNDL